MALSLMAVSAPHEGYVTFGDSLSDPGNHYAIFQKVSSSPFDEMSGAPYDIGGGHRFTNGPTWIEQLADDSQGPAFERPKFFWNYAVGGARARAGSPVFSAYDLSTQVQAYFNDNDGQASPRAKYMVWIGANDLTEALIKYALNSSASFAIMDDAIDAIESNIQKLSSAGARKINLLNIPDLGIAPVVRSHGFFAEMIATWLTEEFNAKLASMAERLNNTLSAHDSGFFINLIDIDALLKAGIEDEVLSLEPCLSFEVEENAICSEPEKHLFWDGIHPTTEGHRLITAFVRNKL